MKTKDIMNRDIICVTRLVAISEAFEIMRRMHVRHLPVVDGTRLLGIVSDRDILPFTQDGGVVDDRSVADVMSDLPIVASPKTQIARAVQHMLQYKIDALPVVRGDTLVGLVTSTDLMALLLTSFDAGNELPFEFNLVHLRTLRQLNEDGASSS
jgi:acetoin utilization protein AcuB